MPKNNNDHPTPTSPLVDHRNKIRRSAPPPPPHLQCIRVTHALSLSLPPHHNTHTPDNKMTCPLYVSGNYKLAKQLNSSLRQSRTRYAWALTLKNLQAENKDYWFEPSLFAET